MVKIDLHTHSSHSHDGEIEPAALVELARDAGVEYLAVADHNRASAIPEAVRAGREWGVNVVPGIEIDCRHKDANIHLLGLFIDYLDDRYAELWERARRRKADLNGKRIKRIRALGLHLDGAVLAAKTGKDGLVTGVVIAETAMQAPENADSDILRPYRPGGAKADKPYVDFWWDWCAKGKPAYVEEEAPSLREAVALIASTGGVPIVAHPGCNIGHHVDYLPELKDEGVVGLEAYCSYHNPEQAAFWHGTAEEYELLVTWGSDFHGFIKPGIKLGDHGAEALAEGILAALLAEREGRRIRR